MMNKQRALDTSLLPFGVIRMAASGNVDAINAILKHYESYITASAKKPSTTKLEKRRFPA